MAPPTEPNSKPVMQSNVKLTTIDLIGGILCSTCNVTYINKKDYDEHYRKLHTIEKDIWYSCVVCCKDIHGYASFRGHCYTMHVIKNKFKCQTCFKCFSKQSVLDEHVATQHQFKCPPPCNKEFPTKRELKLHQIVHKDAGPPYACQQCSEPIQTLSACQHHTDCHAQFTYTCPICSDTFPDKPSAGQHLTKHFIGEILQITDTEEEGADDDCAILATGGVACAVCHSLHRGRPELDQHYEEEHEDQRPVYACNWCGEQFPRFHSLANHCYNHVVKGKFKCETCAKPFSRLSLLVAHSRECDGSERPFHCTSCPAAFTDEAGRIVHVRHSHGHAPSAGDRHHCPEPACQMTFEKRYELLIHQMSHRGTDSWCRACGLEFKTLASCERHLDVHRRIRLLCPVCQKPFTEKHLASKHIAQHFSTVLHVCKTCGNVYNAKFRLAEHIKSHADAKSFECKRCGKGFLLAAAYQQHLNTHTGDKPFKCVACEKAFKSYSNWFKHVRRVHGIDPKTLKKPDPLTDDCEPPVATVPQIENQTAQKKQYICDLCDKSFMCRRYWEKHVLRTHNLDPKTLKKPSQDGGSDGQAMQDVSSDENGPEALEEAHMYVQSVESEYSQKGFVELTVEAEAEVMQQDVSVTTSGSDDDHVYVRASMMPESSGFISDTSAPQPAATEPSPDYPREYGPDFINYQGIPAPTFSSHVIHLDDHLLPHIDPLLTINQESPHLAELLPTTFEHQSQDDNLNTKWEPPIITKFYQGYYGQMSDISSNIMSVMSTDIY